MARLLPYFWLFVGYGLAPFWVTVLYGVGNGIRTPGYALLGLIPSGPTVLSAMLAVVVYERSTGTPERRLRLAAVALIGCLIALAAGFVFIVKNSFSNEREQQAFLSHEKQLVAEFVKSNEVANNAVGAIRDTGSIDVQMHGGIPVRYVVSIEGNRKAFAVVNVARSEGKPQFVLKCIGPRYGTQPCVR